MTTRTAARSSAVLGLGALGALVLAAPASALDAAALTEQVTAPVDATVQPLLAPLEQTAAPVVDAAPAPVQDVVQTVTGSAPPGGGPVPGPGPGTPREEPPAEQPENTTGGGAPAPASRGETTAPQPPRNPVLARTEAPAGAATASMPSSFIAGTGSQLTGGFGRAAEPMSLFGAPQVAPLGAETLPDPVTAVPAGGALLDAFPSGAPAGLPAALVAVACTVVAGSVAAHVAALRARREGLAST